MADVFVSYSRRDKEFVGKLVEALAEDGRDIWVDWEDIPRAADWMNEINKGIENATTFIFVVSSNSLTSKVCTEELRYALELNKRIVPLIREDIAGDVETMVKGTWSGKEWETDAHDNWTAVSHLNWLFFNNDDDAHFQKEFKDLLETLDTDLDHIKMHTRILVREREWEELNRKPSYLLGGDEIEQAEKWLADADAEKKLPEPSKLQRKYIQESRKVENERLENLRRLENRTRQFRMAAGVLGIAIVAAIIAVFFAFNETARAQDEAAQAGSIASTAESVAATAGIAAINAEEQVEVAVSTLEQVQPALTQAANDVETANIAVTEANVAVVNANATLTPIPPTLTQAAEQIVVAQAAVDNANLLVATAEIQVAEAEAELTSIPPTVEALNIQIAEAEERVESLNIAAQAIGLGTAANERLNNDDAETAALLAIRSLNLQYNETADTTLVNAANQLYTDVLIYSEDEAIHAGAMSGDAQTVIVGYTSSGVAFYDVATQTLGDTLSSDHRGWIYAADFSPDGSLAATADENGVIVIWDVSTQAPVASFNDHEMPIAHVTFSDDGQQMVSSDEIGDFCLYDVSDLSSNGCNSTDHGFISGSAFGEGNDLYVNYANGFDLWNASNGEFIETYGAHRTAAIDVDYDPANRVIATGGVDSLLVLTDARNYETIATLDDNSNVISLVEFTNDGRYLVTSSLDNTPRLWDMETLQVVRRFSGHLDEINNLSVSDDGLKIFTSSVEGTARIWDADVSRSLGVLRGHEDIIQLVQYSLDGQYVASVSGFDSSIRVWDTRTNQLVNVLQPEDQVVGGIILVPGEPRLFYGGDNDIIGWNFETGDIQPVGIEGGFVQEIRGNRDLSYLALNYEDRLVINDPDENAVDVTQDSAYDFDVAIDANLLVWTFNDPEIFYAPLDDPSDISRIRVDRLVETVGISPDGTTLIIGTGANDIRFIDVATGDVLNQKTPHTGFIQATRFSPDGRFALSAAYDETVVIYDAQTYDIVRTYTNHSDWVWDASFSADGLRVVSAGSDRTVQVWDVDIETLMNRVCERLQRDLTSQERERFNIEGDSPTCP